ncbi:tetratricopeptide repeat protein [uncultured Polaribacter sp.]|uniref:tetratricopeptide repeat protein n=1 Tax=uncultured Polaribacter sp. TaxID=174711 RepID=UPI002623FB6A|nr:tetratricopeptide repeat protein [uncultured Polaribacter sp.]
MKKQIIAFSLGLMTIGAYAQKNELKAAEKALKKNDFKTAKAAILSIQGLEDSMDAKYKAKYLFLKGQAYGKSDVEKAADAYNKLFSYEKEIGKSKYTKAAKPKLNELIQFVSQKGIDLYNNDQDFKEAAKNFYLTYKLSPTDTSFLYNAAASAARAKEYEKSNEYYKILQEIGYNGSETQYFAVNKSNNKKENLGGKSNRDLMVKLGKYTNPTEVSTESKKSLIVKSIGYNYVKLGKTDEAILALQEARKSDPKDLNLILNEADLYVKLDKMDKFGELMVEAVKLDPENPTLFYNLGVVNARQNKAEEAIGYYKKAIELRPDYADAYLNLGVSILNKRIPVIEEMNNNLSNDKVYEALEVKLKAINKDALPYLEKADSLKRSIDTVKALLNIYDNLEMEAEGDKFRAIFKELKDKN